MATLTAAARNAGIEAIGALCNSGTIEFQTSGDVEVATCTFGATAFGSGSTGTITANSITDDSSATGGVIDHAKFFTSGAAEVLEATCTVTSGGGDFELTSLTIGAGDTVSVTSLTMTLPAT